MHPERSLRLYLTFGPLHLPRSGNALLRQPLNWIGVCIRVYLIAKIKVGTMFNRVSVAGAAFCCVAFFFCSLVRAAALTPGDILVSAQYVNSNLPNAVLEYTPSGTLVQGFNIPYPIPNDEAGSAPGGLAITANGQVQIYDGVFDAYCDRRDHLQPGI
jgi:hypothetical protein